jgi:flagellar biosynthesis/type III secretory pathway protein FliH
MREKAWRDEYARLVYAQQEGLEEGRQKGLQEGIQKGLQEGIQKQKADILKLINEGLTTEQIRALLLDGRN